MAISNTFLYYPTINIPDETLIYSLLYKDEIKRIIPSAHDVKPDAWEEYDRPRRIIRTALGYDFIEEADYYDSKRQISQPFLALINDSYHTNHPKYFEPLFGKNFQINFKFSDSKLTIGTRYLLYPKKLDEDVFTRLEEIGWTKYDERTYTCEAAKKLWHVYMTLLAANISKSTGEAVSTDFVTCEEILRNSVFQDYFKDMLPDQYSGKGNLYDACMTFLFNNVKKDEPEKGQIIPIHKLLTLQQASYVRAGLEDKRKSFCEFVDNLIKKVRAMNPADALMLMETEIAQIKEVAFEFNNELNNQIRDDTAVRLTFACNV